MSKESKMTEINHKSVIHSYSLLDFWRFVGFYAVFNVETVLVPVSTRYLISIFFSYMLFV